MTAPGTASGAGAVTLRRRDWLDDPRTQAVFQALGDGVDDGAVGAVARAVGGCVRDGLLGLAVHDVDIATVLTPEAVTARARAAGLAVVPTGIDHGTVTVIADHRPHEVTTLRRDVSTDGRRATIAFTTDWAEDASRRDFTINALYADRTGRVHDPMGSGLSDLAAGPRLRFIGDGDRRLAEDRLRLLRFFRFWARFDPAPPDAAAIAACAAHAPALLSLSGERIWSELARILTGPRAAEVWDLMARHAILATLLPQPGPGARLAVAAAWDTAGHRVPAALRLAAVAWPPDPSLPPPPLALLASRLRLSRDEAQILGNAPSLAALDAAALAADQIRRTAWRLAPGAAGVARARQALLLALMLPTPAAPVAAAALARLQEWTVPVLPITGRDLIAAGLAPGPGLGARLARAETAWVASDFTLGTAACLAIALCDGADAHDRPGALS